ncbi:MAG: hypothetical protein WCK90_01885 [archaeon]
MVDRKYSRNLLFDSAVRGSIRGIFNGTLDGLVGGFAIPTAVRLIDKGMDGALDASNQPSLDMYQRVEGMFEHMTRIPIRTALLGWAGYRLITNLKQGGDAECNFTLMGNAASTLYELYQAGKRRAFG